MNHNKIELLSPAGSYEGFEAVLGAGADAVYVGGAAFGARAYAKNFQQEELLRAIDQAHLHDRKLYLTVNTLLKNKELEEQLYEYILPYYKEGLDAVLIQDMGVLRFLRRNFPDLPLHASTQMTITGPEGMRMMEAEGLTRIVGARELSLQELKAMHEASKLEIEAFIHGALCYSYSGQCLMSSIFGGRSGNRGRCAQPCRLSYQTSANGDSFKGKKDLCPLSLKDICTIDFLPELIDAGVMSLKIEGRMKQPQYAAGVTAMYRKYLDLLLEKGPENYRVSDRDKRFLLDLFNRGGSCDGYLKQHNGSSMMAFTNEKKTGDVEVALTKAETGLRGKVMLYAGAPAYLTIEAVGASGDFAHNQSESVTSVTVSAGEVQPASGRPVDEARIRQQLNKLGNTGYRWESLDIEMEDNLFLPMGALNELRREGIASYEKMILDQYHREVTPEFVPSYTMEEKNKPNNRQALYVSCETMEQAEEAMGFREIQGLYLPYRIMQRFMDAGYQKQKELYLSLPHMVRGQAPEGFFDQAKKWIGQGMSGLLIRNPEGFALALSNDLSEKCVIDASLYTWNNEAIQYFRDKKVLRNTAPLELNEKELAHRSNRESEMVVYGYLPLMNSVQCVRKNLFGCDHKEAAAYLKDRYGAEFRSQCFCNPWKVETTRGNQKCYNIIYNSLPLSLIRDQRAVEKLGFQSLRLSFTIENREETGRILRAFIDAYTYGKTPQDLPGTRGHFRRGAE